MAGYFKSLFSQKSVAVPEKWGGTWFYPVGYADGIFNSNQFLKDFLEIPELNAVINLLARMEASWKLDVISKATGQPAKNAEQAVKIIRTPNWFQGQGEFWRQSAIFRHIYANEYLYFLTPTGMPSSYKAMFTLDPAKVKIEYKTDTPYFLDPIGDAVKYFYKVGNEWIQLDKSNLIHLNDNRVKQNDFLKGTSKIESLAAPLANIRAAYKKRNIVLNMPVGMISNGNSGDETGVAVPLDPKEKAAAQQALKNHGALPMFTGMAVRYSNMAINSATLGLFEEVREDTGRICDAFGIKYEQLASQKGVTFANLKEADKQVYENTVIPNAQEKIDALNIKFEGKTWEVVGGFNHLPVFSEDIKQRSDSLSKIVQALSKALTDGAITLEQYKTELQKFGI